MKKFSLFLFLFLLPFHSSKGQFLIDTLAAAPHTDFPVCITFPPDGSNRLFYTEKNTGRVRIIRNDTLLTNPYLTVSVTGSGEQGLLGLTFHPNYPDSPYFYIFYTRSGDRANQVVRYREVNGVPTNPQTLMVVPRTNTATIHNGGNIHFGPDGKLYITIGDYSIPSSSQDTSNSNKLGKIHRVNYDGTIPFDNPFLNNTIYAYGSRNSFDFTFDALTGRCYATENGPHCNDEINYILPGRNYGWPVDGNCTYSGDPRYQRPLYYWSSNVPAITGIIIYRGSAFPQLYGKMLVAHYNYGSVEIFSLNAGGDSIIGGPTTLINFNSGLNDIEVGPDGYIYITNGTYGGTSRIFRLRPLLLPTPILVSPPNGAINQSRRPTIIWKSSAGAARYHLQVSTDSSFSAIIFDDSTLIDTTKLLPPLYYITKYYWRVRAHNNTQSSLFSSVWNFTTLLPPLAAPLLLSPEIGSVIESTFVTLKWRSSLYAESYHLQIAYDTFFTSIVVDDSLLLDTLVTVRLPQANIRYYWRVRALNNEGTSMWSQRWDFIVIKMITVEYRVSPRWNLISLPLTTTNRVKDTLFPTAVSKAFSFTPKTGYIQQETLMNGVGYWLKFPTKQAVTLTGVPLIVDTIDVVAGWNLIGSTFDTIHSGSVTTLPPDIIASDFFGFNNGYFASSVITPMQGYWVKMRKAGKIILNSKRHR